jgi:glycosyltransferase involved in cell wall biosynthesis
MKILIDARMYGLEYTGVGRYVMNLVKEIQKNDSQNDYIILLRPKYFRQLKLAKNFKKVVADFGIYSIREQIGMPLIFFRERPDITHFVHFNVPLFFPGKFVVTLHDMTTHKTTSEGTNLPLIFFLAKKAVYKLLFKVAVKRSVKVIVPTQSVKEEICNYYKIDREKAVVIYQGLDRSFLGKTRKEDKILKKHRLKKSKYLVHVGNIFPHKNIKRLIDALDVLRNEKISIKLVLVTKKNNFFLRTRDYIREKDLGKQIVVFGFLTDQQLKSLYYYSLGYIYPSYSEGFGLQGLEALASGAKLLASDIPVFREVYGNCAFYFDPMNPYSIATAIKEAVNMPPKEGVYDLLKKYSWTKTAINTIEVYTKC